MLSVLVLMVGGCHADGLVDVGIESQVVSAHLGQDVAVTLGNVGPGTYASPPQISSGVLTYLGVDIVPPFTPGGPHQRFLFHATKPGRAIVEFRRYLGASILAVVQDTVDVH